MEQNTQPTDRTIQFAEDGIIRLMYRYSLPSIVAMLTMMMFNLINMAFVGRSVGALGIAAIAISMPLMMIQGSISQLVGNGCAAMVSITLGKGDREGSQGILGCSITVSLMVAGINMVLGFMFMTPLLRAFGASEAILPLARDYMAISLFGMGFSAISTMNPILRIEGFPRQAMYTMLCSTLLNFAFAPLFIFVFHMGIRGAALGSFCAQIGSALWIFLFMINKKRVVRLEWRFIRIRFRTILEVMQLGLPTFLMQITQSLLSVVMNTSLGSYGGDIAISAWGVTNNINNVVAQPIFGLNQGIQPIIGYNYGAKNYRRVKQTLIYALTAATIFSVVSWILIWLFPEPIIAFFNNDPELIRIGSRMLIIFRMCIFVVGFQQAGASYFQFCGQPGKSIFLTISRQVLILIPCILILPRFFQLDGILYSGPVSDVISTILTAFYVFAEVRRLNTLIAQTESEPKANSDTALDPA
ncbi:MAG: MATE family efflux transporter [Clostridiales bacterium]|nr:MATE family efflux transporter [Clostridiales bacterium]